MENVHILCISDIHFDGNEPENQGLVLLEFFKDLEDRFNGIDDSSRYCIIAGDLVKAGNSQHIYDKFFDSFIKKLGKIIPLEHILCTPGNHDLNRLEIKNSLDEHNALISYKDKSESDFNHDIKSEDSIIRKKFKPFDSFCKNKLRITEYDLYGYYINIIPEISVYCLNTALLSNGGLDGLPKDEGILKIETSNLYEWASNNSGRTKLLVLHHPIYYLNEYIRREISNLIDKHINIIITGHIHEPDLKKLMGTKSSNVAYCSCPQLFSDKHDQNGYSILHFTGAQLFSIEYRKWSTIREVFTAGADFTGTDSGVIKFSSNQSYSEEDIITKALIDSFNNSLNVYLYSPSWVDRTLSNLSPQARRNTGTREVLYDHLDVINSKDNFQIIGGPQFGLTTFARKLALDAWMVNSEHWMYFDAKDANVAKLHQVLYEFVQSHKITKSEVSAIVLDGCNSANKLLTKVLDKAKELMPKARLILLNEEYDDTIINGIDVEETSWNFQILYLRELGRKGIRNIVKEFITKQGFDRDPEDSLLQRLMIDIMDLNVHRTPINCIQLLLSFKQNYDSRPVNRSKVLSSLIQLFFIKPDSFFFTDSLDEDDCCIIMGALCEFLFRNDGYKQFFTDSDFRKAMQVLDGRYTPSQLDELFKSMISAQIIISHYNYYTFRFTYWVYYFSAYQMHISDEFYSFMIDKKCIYMPEIIEYYTGINPKCKELVNNIANELINQSNSVSHSLGIEVGNPYNYLKWGPNKVLEGKTTEQLEADIKASRLPEEVKDAVLDSRADNVKPFIQVIDQVLDEYQVKNMMLLARSASRALRNCNYLLEDDRKTLYNAITVSWKSLMSVLILLTPALAKTGYGGYGGASFMLTGDFPEEAENRLIPIITNIPFNIIEWYKNDVFSEKRTSIYKDAVNNHFDPVIKHISALLILRNRPSGWKDIIKAYINSLPKNSFYLGDIYHNLMYCYQLDTMSMPDLGNTRRLIELCVNNHGRTRMYLPQREVGDR